MKNKRHTLPIKPEQLKWIEEERERIKQKEGFKPSITQILYRLINNAMGKGEK